VIATERLYPIRRPLAAACAGAAVAVLGGLIGLGGAEFRLPILIAIFALYAHRAIRINLLISLATLAMSAAARLGFVHTTKCGRPQLGSCRYARGRHRRRLVWRGLPQAHPQDAHHGCHRRSLTAALLAIETMISGSTWTLFAPDSPWRMPAAVVAGLLVGAISSLLGVAGGEFIIPILIFIFGADIKTAGTASVLISIPIVLTGVTRHWLTGHYRSQSMLTYLVLPMCIGSLLGAMVGGYLAAWVPTDALRLVLATILAASAIKLWSKSAVQNSN
jgi:uncharacterized membrane protein YfcA